MASRTLVPLAVACLLAASQASGQVVPYNPYAAAEAPLPPVAADGTINWGVFYKSAALQQNYMRLWSLGACRGTNRAITEPVQRNKLVIDLLPEADHAGVVQATAGTLAGGLIAFTETGSSTPLVIQLHPAGVTRLAVTGRSPASLVKPGLVVRLTATVDAEGRVTEAVRSFDIVTPPADFQPDEIEPGKRSQIVGRVARLHAGVVMLQLPKGRLRKVRWTLDPEAIATIDAGQLDLVAAGDKVAVTGRLWSGEGSMGGGTLFASTVSVSKPPLPGEAAPAAAAVAAGP